MQRRLRIRRLLNHWPISLWVGIVLGYLVWVVVRPESGSRATSSLLILFGLRSWATGVMIRAAIQIDEARRKRTWQFISFAFVCWTVVDGIVATIWITDGALPAAPHGIDLVRLAGYLVIMVVVFGYPKTSVERLRRTRDQLDMALIGAGVIGLAWLMFLLPIISLRYIDPLAVFWRSLYPVFDMLLLAYFIRLMLLADSSWDRKNLSFLSLATFVFSISDLIFGVLALQESFQPGGWVEAGWMIGSGFYLFVAYRTTQIPSATIAAEDLPPSNFARRLVTLMPIGITGMVVGYLMLDWWMGGQVEVVGVALVILLAVLLVARQGVIAGQMEFRQYASLVTNAVDMAFVCDLDGRLLLVNPAFSRDLLLDAEKSEIRNILDVVRNPSRWGQLVDDARETGWSGEITFRRQDGSTFPAALALRPIEDEHKSRVVLAGTAHDLTQIKERENALHAALRQVASARAELEDLNLALEEKVEHRTRELEKTVQDLARLNEELQELDKLKTEFVALVSHELRAPLTNISTGIELILSGPSKLGTVTTDSLELVQVEIHRLSKLVETILDLSSLEAGRFPLDIRPVKMKTIAGRVAQRYIDGEHAGRLELKITDDLPPALADEQAVGSIFQHLLDNALKYASKGAIALEGWCEGNHLWIAVDDGGEGIPEQERDRIFDMFHRLDTRDNRDTYGYGLGLSMVKRLLEAMQGGIRVEESQRGGARFVFWLPIQAESEER